ncbi:alpha/beta fold hydrolase [Spirosoma linguale]|uniref:Hydrolase or acyltransferase (Alpha/beta hydrolase superfamily)-like protein n=1 Tax=Spirosoma linguale (strain ATCC 33905 / DSM 74 / LMG 10896 / Claus 1) TaxID=504472 RepID=D2QHR3_SPILD|nr:hydrolase or acyltransferase (alpha/beta hydrolase superfamily)-like protein [Spirosoma linguale DSM 74]
MSSANYSRYKNPQQATEFNDMWARHVQDSNGLIFESVTVLTTWGKTVVWVHTPKRRVYETLVFFPGFNSSALTWAINRSLAGLSKNYRLCLIEINGQPGFSDGLSPSINTDEYGIWAQQVLEQLGVARVTLIAHSLGALISLKVCRMAPQLIKRAILINPAGIQSLTLSFHLLRYYWLAYHAPSHESVQSFLREVVFSPTYTDIPSAQEKLLIDFQINAFSNFQLTSWWHLALPKEELLAIKTPLYMLLGAQDKLYSYQATLERSIQYLPSLVSITVLPTLGHGVQTCPSVPPALKALLTH